MHPPPWPRAGSARDASAPNPNPEGKPVDGCWFCLGSVAADTELVVSVGEEVRGHVWYLV